MRTASAKAKELRETADYFESRADEWEDAKKTATLLRDAARDREAIEKAIYDLRRGVGPFRVARELEHAEEEVEG